MFVDLQPDKIVPLPSSVKRSFISLPWQGYRADSFQSISVGATSFSSFSGLRDISSAIHDSKSILAK